MAQLPDMVVTIRLDEQQIEDLLARVRQTVAQGLSSTGLDTQTVLELMKRNNEDLVSSLLERKGGGS